jgi:glycosyltransferase involved in cell wall biosynthesis
MARFLIDAVDLGHNEKGVARVLASLTPRVVERSNEEILVACTGEGIRELPGVGADGILLVPRTLQSRWEQWGLPRLARRNNIDAVYSHREAGALWGPPLVLHVPEDPEVRWARNPPASLREHARRAYGRTLLQTSLRRCAVAAASTGAVAAQLAARYRAPRSTIRVIPLGVDLELFHPVSAPAEDFVFHLGSSDPRDRTTLVVDAWARAHKQDDTLPTLVIGGGLGDVESRVLRRARELNIPLELTGRLSDADLAARFQHAAIVVQPSSDEGFGLQPLEAMAAGAPVVVTAAAAVVDVVQDAAVVCSATPAALADGVLTVRAQADALRARARAQAERFSWDASADAVLEALGEASAGAPTKPPE